MQTTEAQQLLLEIINNAEEGKSFKFQFITSWQEFIYYRRQLKATKLIISTLESSSNNLLKSYYKDVTAGISDLNTILAYAKIKDIIKFYENDLVTIKRMLDEYDEYLCEGNFWFSFLGGRRFS